MKKGGMKLMLSTVFLALSLLCGVQGQPKCIPADYDNFWEAGSGSLYCGCELHDASGTPVFNISLEFFETRTAKDGDFDYTYSPCLGETDCNDNAVAICRHRRLDPIAKHESIGLLDNVTYIVNNATRVNISALYAGEDGTSSIVHLVCDDNAKSNGSFKFVREDKQRKVFYFEMSYFDFCAPPPHTITTTRTHMPTMTITSMITTTSTATNKPSENKEDKDRKVVLGIVLSIVGAIIVGVILAIVVYFVWKKKRGASYEKIPTM